ncbi:MAG: FAD-dependent oxidoreductase [Chlorobiaceae bacterium]|nr:FAD-dependent oxidoreductase [Chlorobiaceae bacterium]
MDVENKIIRKTEKVCERHAIIIGAGIGGLAAGALLARRGIPVTVFEARRYPGGCASDFTAGRYRFDSGATVGCGFHDGAPLHRLGCELGLVWPVRPEPLAWQYRHKSLHLDLLPGRENIIARFPRSKRFWEEQSKLARLLWQLSADGLPWPPSGVEDILGISSRVFRLFPRSAQLLPFLRRSAHDWLASHQLDTDPDFMRFIDAQLLISVQSTAPSANALYAAIALDLPVSGTWQVEGGIGTVARLLAGSIERDGGRVLYNRKVIALDTAGTRVQAVKTDDGEEFVADLVIANMTPEALDLLQGRAPLDERKTLFSRWSAFMLYLGIDAAVFDHAGANHLQLMASEGDPGEGRSLFVSASPADDLTRAPEGERAVTVSTHSRSGPWFEALQQGRGAYEVMKEKYTDSVLRLLCEQLSEAEGAIRSMMAATPCSWERWTGRHLGVVGGYPQTSLFNVRGPSTGYENLFLVGDSIFPGQSLPGVVTGARRCVELLLSQAGKYVR